ncbi:MAG: type I restriction enzyme HsdR N-terminal domain-containing protein [Bacteroidales bacterium]|nr:type I restriction enzyme HsdR N-terminal domain-containing protein [Bacteroidales bacterium]
MELIWDPLRRKEVAATPEERVRQWFITLLRDTFGVPEHMMMSEVGFRFGAKPYRADIVVYDREAKPLAVVECKRPEVALSEAVVEQAMRYNSVLGVRFLMLTNGKLTYLYRLEGDRFVPCERIPRYEEMLCQR